MSQTKRPTISELLFDLENIVATSPVLPQFTTLWKPEPAIDEYSHVIAEPVEGGYLDQKGRFFKSGDDAIFKKAQKG